MVLDGTSSSKIHLSDLIFTGVNRFSLTVAMADTIVFGLRIFVRAEYVRSEIDVTEIVFFFGSNGQLELRCRTIIIHKAFW